MKDNFSSHSRQYSVFRPTYPDEAIEFILNLVNNKTNVWDCGTGNGQLAGKLSPFFQHVYATDISENQIMNAVRKDNITYEVVSAENVTFNENFFDLITVAQAIHWFDFDNFYEKVRHTLKPDGIIAVIGYNLMTIDGECDKIIHRLYSDILGDTYWDKERKYLDEQYKTIPFPFQEIQAPSFSQKVKWNLDELIGYLNTWSAVQHFIKKNGTNPVDEVRKDFEKMWGKEKQKEVTFPTLLRIGKLK
ncbi:class I SAM-dependent methyltransferase [Dyadobacter frigoris]|uniref:Class I SAM-dependent methyltransferase n=1 Tax=Dyadobacter frigoris TaxID=2576211 RepID=A0A4U6D3B3_9BACT|nr:class I SAM-dependent methyltransferase [Dyadobacter frigoris]TKT91770.1 class I SAM-dependent methyltransferase [Dyadobacter frigoris]GLU55583.1 methyltransferase [Dyadobacter frigoris]